MVRNYKKEYEYFQGTPEQKKRRAQRNAARYDALLMHLNTVQAERDAARAREDAVHD